MSRLKEGTYLIVPLSQERSVGLGVGRLRGCQQSTSIHGYKNNRSFLLHRPFFAASPLKLFRSTSLLRELAQREHCCLLIARLRWIPNIHEIRLSSLHV